MNLKLTLIWEQGDIVQDVYIPGKDLQLLPMYVNNMLLRKIPEGSQLYLHMVV